MAYQHINSLEGQKRRVPLEPLADSSSSLRANVVYRKTGNVLEKMPLPLWQINLPQLCERLVLL